MIFRGLERRVLWHNNYLTLNIKSAFVFIIINFLQMGSGFEIEKEVSDANTPTWCLEEELDDLQQASFVSEVDKRRIVELQTLLAVRSEMKS